MKVTNDISSVMFLGLDVLISHYKIQYSEDLEKHNQIEKLFIGYLNKFQGFIFLEVKYSMIFYLISCEKYIVFYLTRFFLG